MSRVEYRQRLLVFSLLIVQGGREAVVVGVIRIGSEQRTVDGHRRVEPVRGDQQPSELSPVPEIARVEPVGPQAVLQGFFRRAGSGVEDGELVERRGVRRVDRQHFLEQPDRAGRVALHHVVLDSLRVKERSGRLRIVFPIRRRFSFRTRRQRTGRLDRKQHGGKDANAEKAFEVHTVRSLGCPAFPAHNTESNWRRKRTSFSK